MASARPEPEPGHDGPEAKRPRLDAEGANQELVAAAAKLRQTREAVEAGGTPGMSSEEDVAALLALLRRLGTLQVTGLMLKQTGVGREVNQRWLRAHSDSRLQAESRALLQAWMTAPGVAASGAARPGQKGEASEVSPPKTSKPQAATDTSTSRTGLGREAAEPTVPKASKPEAATARSPEIVREQKAPAEVDAATSGVTAQQQKTADTPSQDAEAGSSAAAAGGKKEPKAARAKKPKTESKSKAADAGPCPNEALADAFKELAGFEFQQKATFKGAAYKKVEKALREIGEKIVDVAQVRGLAGFGKASQAKIAEFLEKGSMERLEKYRRGEFGDNLD